MATYVRTQEIAHEIGARGHFALRVTSPDVELRAGDGTRATAADRVRAASRQRGRGRRALRARSLPRPPGRGAPRGDRAPKDRTRDRRHRPPSHLGRCQGRRRRHRNASRPHRDCLRGGQRRRHRVGLPWRAAVPHRLRRSRPRPHRWRRPRSRRLRRREHSGGSADEAGDEHASAGTSRSSLPASTRCGS